MGCPIDAVVSKGISQLCIGNTYCLQKNSIILPMLVPVFDIYSSNEDLCWLKYILWTFLHFVVKIIFFKYFNIKICG